MAAQEIHETTQCPSRDVNLITFEYKTPLESQHRSQHLLHMKTRQAVIDVSIWHVPRISRIMPRRRSNSAGIMIVYALHVFLVFLMKPSETLQFIWHEVN